MASTHETVVRVAILADEPLGWGSGKHYFPAILDGYSWHVGGRSYRFTAQYVYERDVLAGRLRSGGYAILLVPGGGVGDGLSVTMAFTWRSSVQRWKEEINRFVEAGGSYVGICGGSALMTGLQTGNGRPRSIMERLYDLSAVGASCVQSYYRHLSLPIFTWLQRQFPERVGATGYVFSFAPGETVDGKRLHAAGVPVDFDVSKDNAVFGDHAGDRLRMRWWGGPGLVVPASADRKVSVWARYPDPDFSTEPRTAVFAWRYTGGLRGLARAVVRSASLAGDGEVPLGEALTYAYYFAAPWKRSEEPIDLGHAGLPCITAEVYPNEHEGRIVLCAAHPEYMIWSGGEITPVAEGAGVCLATGLHRWRGIGALSDTLEDELTSTWWVVRRMVAWAGKVPDTDMPPIEKGSIGVAAREIIEKNIRWDGTLLDQMRNI